MNIVKLDQNRIILIHDDCLHAMRAIKPNSIDMVFADLPYGTTACKWDQVIPFENLWENLKRCGKVTTPFVFTAQSPFDKVLGVSNLQELKYEWIWCKSNPTGHLNAKIQPMKIHENILVFYKEQCTYNPQFWDTDTKRIVVRGKRDSLNYGATIDQLYQEYVGRYPYSILTATTQRTNHSTQKPTELLEYLIKTYTNVGDTVLDPTMGSGTTGVACVKLYRRFIGIEKDENYFNIAVSRIQNELRLRDETTPQVPATCD